MIDIFSTVAGVITVAGAVTEAIKYAKKFYKAFEELEALQNQIERFTHVLQEIDKQKISSYSAAIAAFLVDIKHTLEQFNELLRTRLWPKADASSRIRRRSWVKNRSRLYKMRDELKDQIGNLSVIIAVNGLYIPLLSLRFMLSWSLTKDRRSSIVSSEDETKSLVKGQSSDCSEKTLCGLRAQLSSIQQSQRETNAILRSQTRATQLYRHYEGAHQTVQSHTTSQAGFSYSPTNVLDGSSRYFPHTYTQDAKLPEYSMIFFKTYQEIEMTTAGTFSINVYKALYLQSPTRWGELTISLRISSSSRYSKPLKIASGKHKTKPTPGMGRIADLPPSLLKKLQASLVQNNMACDNLSISIAPSDADDVLEVRSPKALLRSEPTIEPGSLYSDEFNFVRGLGCPRYVESEVCQVDIIRPPTQFLSCVNSLIVHEFRVNTFLPRAEAIYNIHALYGLRDVPGFPRLVGVVTDDTGIQLKSYLTEVQETKWSLIQTFGDPSLPWEYRERWAIQLVQAVKEAHSRGFVVGSVITPAPPLVVNDGLNLSFWILTRRLMVGRKNGSYYPPELLHYAAKPPPTNEAGYPYLTAATDIFHLGLLLWLMAESFTVKEPLTSRNPHCYRARCGDRTICRADLSHAEPIALPPLMDDIPEYFRSIVDSCRARLPEDRPTAAEILDKLPAARPNVLQAAFYPSNVTDLGASMKALGKRCVCDICDAGPDLLDHFHCDVCDLGDHDICRDCFNKGRHCLDDTHWLVQSTKKGGITDKYFSSVQCSGKREVLEL